MPPIQKGRLDSRHGSRSWGHVDKELTCCATARYGSEGTITKGIISALIIYLFNVDLRARTS